MNISESERYREIKNRYQKLLRDWKKNNKPCIICAKEVGNSQDHLPPEVLYPKKLRSDRTYLFTFPVCSKCNKESSDNDFLLSVYLSYYLNQDAYLKNQEPKDTDLLALHEQTERQIKHPTKGAHRLRLLQPYVVRNKATGKVEIKINKLPINKTLIKIVKAIYWLNTGGDILENYHPGWWILSNVDSSKESFIEKHLKISHADIFWEDKFISHYSIGQPHSGADGFISCSLHFYTEKSIRKGISWHLIASPVNTKIDGKSLFELCKSVWGNPAIAPIN